MTSSEHTGLLDTNTIILLDRLNPADLPHQPAMSTVTLAELSVGPLATDNPSERADRQARLQETESAFDALPFDTSAAHAFGRVAAGLRQHGRKTTARAYDALIAATAIANNLPVYTCNPRDFEGIDGITVVAIPHPDHD